MLNRRPPQDNFPDDFDTHAYAHHRPGLRTWRLRWRGILRRAWVTLLMVLLLALSFVAALFILPPPEPQVVIIAPTATPPGDIQGDFPAGVQQQSITLPARIDNVLAPGASRGYRFYAHPSATWRVSLASQGDFDPLLILYNPDGTVQELSNNLAEGILFQPRADSAQYGVLVQGDAAGGTYTLRILPVD